MAKKQEQAKPKVEAKEPQEPQTAEELINEVNGIDNVTAPITFDGETYAINPALVNDIEVLEAFQRGNRFFPPELNGALTALQKSLGPDYEKFKADQTRKHGSCRATAIFEMFAMIDARAGGN